MEDSIVKNSEFVSYALTGDCLCCPRCGKPIHTISFIVKMDSKRINKSSNDGSSIYSFSLIYDIPGKQYIPITKLSLLFLPVVTTEIINFYGTCDRMHRCKSHLFPDLLLSSIDDKKDLDVKKGWEKLFSQYSKKMEQS